MSEGAGGVGTDAKDILWKSVDFRGCRQEEREGLCGIERIVGEAGSELGESGDDFGEAGTVFALKGDTGIARIAQFRLDDTALSFGERVPGSRGVVQGPESGIERLGLADAQEERDDLRLQLFDDLAPSGGIAGAVQMGNETPGVSKGVRNIRQCGNTSFPGWGAGTFEFRDAPFGIGNKPRDFLQRQFRRQLVERRKVLRRQKTHAILPCREVCRTENRI